MNFSRWSPILLSTLFIFFLLASPGICLAQGCCPDSNSAISTYAGTGTVGYTGDGGPAISATFNYVGSVLIDPVGNLYLSDSGNSVIRKITPGGIISTVAGIGTAGFSGDGGPATSAQFNDPVGLLRDAAGNIYICDILNYRIRKIDTSGIISTFAGNGVAGYTGDGGPAVSASLNATSFIAMDGVGNILITDEGNNAIRKISASGIITTIAGNGTAGFSGDGGPAILALLATPETVAVDPSGNIYFNDDSNHRIRKIDTSGIITTVAGNGTYGYTGDGGPATSAAIGDLHGMAFCGGRIYFADLSGYIRMIDPCGIITTIAGKGLYIDSGDGGPASAANLNNPAAMVFDGLGNLYVGEGFGTRIRKIVFDCAPTPTLTCVITPAPTATPTMTPTWTATPIPTPTTTPMPTPSPTSTMTWTPTGTSTAIATFTPICAIHAWPNPYNPNYAVGGTLKVSCLPAGATVSFYTVTGELVNQVKEAGGMAQWKGTNRQGAPVSSGIYFYVIQNGSNVLVKSKFLINR